MNVFSEFLIILLFSLGASLVIPFFTFQLFPRIGDRSHTQAMLRLFPRTLDHLFLISVSMYVVVFTVLASLRHLTIHSYTDLGLYDQIVWNSLHGRLFENSLIADATFYLGKSFSPILLAFVPIYALWSDPLALLFVETLALGLAAFPIYWLARERMGRGLGLVVCLAYFLSPLVESVNLADVHGIAFATPLLSFAAYFLLHRRYAPLVVCLSLALLVREEIALVIIGFGAFIFLFQRERRFGVALSATAAALTIILLTLVIPFFRGPEYGAGFYYFGSGATGDASTRYTYLGHSIGEIATTIFTKPGVVLEHLLVPDKIEFVLDLLVPLGLLPLIGLEATALALPTLGYSLLSDFSFQYSVYSSYGAPLIPFLFFGTILGAQRLLQWARARLGRVSGSQVMGHPSAYRYALACWILTGSLAGYFFIAPGPLARHFQPSLLTFDPSSAARHEIADSIPPGATVVAQSEWVAHLSQRQFIYDFPSIPDYRQADFLVADRNRFWYEFHKPSWDEFLGSGYFDIVIQRDGITLARRRAIEHPRQIRYANGITLLGYSLPLGQSLRGGTSLRPIVFWRTEQSIAEKYKMTVRVVDAHGHVWAEEDREPDAGFTPTDRWVPGKIVGDQYTLLLPPTMPGGKYEIVIAVHTGSADDYSEAVDEQGNTMGNAPVVTSLDIQKNQSSFAADELKIEQPLFVDMQELRFLGSVLPQTTIRAGDEFHVGLYWRARTKPIGDYAVVVQLLDQNAREVFEQSSRPANGTYPTTQWAAGEVLLDWHDFNLPQDLPASEYRLVVLLRDLGKNQSLGQADLATVTITQ